MQQKNSRNRLRSYIHLCLISLGALAVLTAALLHSSPNSVSAAPGDLSSAVAKYPNIASSMLNNCTFCHLGYPPNLTRTSRNQTGKQRGKVAQQDGTRRCPTQVKDLKTR